MPNGTSISTYAKSTQAHPASSSGRGAATAHRVSGGYPGAKKNPGRSVNSGRGVISNPLKLSQALRVASSLEGEHRWNRHPRAI